MQVVIEDHFLGEVVGQDKVYGKSPYPDEVLKIFKRRISQIKSARNTAELRTFKSLHFEKMKGKKYEGKYSIRLNDAYRIIFRVENSAGDNRIEIMYIEEINNHYA